MPRLAVIHPRYEQDLPLKNAMLQQLSTWLGGERDLRRWLQSPRLRSRKEERQATYGAPASSIHQSHLDIALANSCDTPIAFQDLILTARDSLPPVTVQVE